MSSLSTHQEWVNLTGIKRNGRPMQEWLLEIVTAYGRLPDDEVDSLSDAAFEWAEEGMKSKNSNQPIQVFFDYDESAEDILEEDEGSVEDDEEMPLAAKPPVIEKANRRLKTDGPTYQYRKLVLENYGLEREAIRQIAMNRGVELAEGSVSGILYHTKQTVELIEEIFGWAVPLAGEKRRRRKKAK